MMKNDLTAVEYLDFRLNVQKRMISDYFQMVEVAEIFDEATEIENYTIQIQKLRSQYAILSNIESLFPKKSKDKVYHWVYAKMNSLLDEMEDLKKQENIKLLHKRLKAWSDLHETEKIKV